MSTSSRNAIKWVKEHDIEYIEQNVSKMGISKSTIYKMLQYSDGFDTIVNPNKHEYKHLVEQGVIHENLHTDEMCDIIVKHPSLLRTPITLTPKTMIVGFGDERMRTLIPRSIRNIHALQNLATAIHDDLHTAHSDNTE